MPAKRKNAGSWKLKAFVLIITFVLVASYLVIFLYPPTGQATLPFASSFSPEEWMSFIPQNASFFQFLNYNVPNIANLLGTNTSLNLSDINYNLSVLDVHYELDILLGTSSVKILGVNETVASFISNSFSALNLTTFIFDNVTMYLINGSSTSDQAWIAVSDGAVLYSVGSTSGQTVISQIVDVKNSTFFSSDPYKIGFLTVSNGGQYSQFYYYSNFDSSLQIDWAMFSVSNPSNPTVLQTFHFPTNAIANSEYSQTKSTYFSKSTNVNIAENYVFGVASSS